MFKANYCHGIFKLDTFTLLEKNFSCSNFMGWIIFNAYYSNLGIHVWENIHSRHHPTQSVTRLEASQVFIGTGMIWSLVEMQLLTLQPWAGVCAGVCIRLCVYVCGSVMSVCDYCSLPGSPVHGIFQARILEQVAISFSRGSSWPRDRTRVSSIAGRLFTVWATREAQFTPKYLKICLDGDNYKTLLKDIKDDLELYIIH